MIPSGWVRSPPLRPEWGPWTEGCTGGDGQKPGERWPRTARRPTAVGVPLGWGPRWHAARRLSRRPAPLPPVLRRIRSSGRPRTRGGWWPGGHGHRQPLRTPRPPGPSGDSDRGRRSPPQPGRRAASRRGPIAYRNAVGTPTCCQSSPWRTPDLRHAGTTLPLRSSRLHAPSCRPPGRRPTLSPLTGPLTLPPLGNGAP